jgi:hypothetical protein
MPDRNDKARFRILEAYERAKSANPAMTQGEFMLAGAPGSRVKNLSGKFRSKDTAARYFRKIKTGERTGGEMYRQGTQEYPGRNIGLFQFRVQTAEGQFISQNIEVAGGSSTFDVAAVEYELKANRRERIEAMVAHYRLRYGQEETEIDIDSLEARPIRHARKMTRMHMSIAS